MPALLFILNLRHLQVLVAGKKEILGKKLAGGMKMALSPMEEVNLIGQLADIKHHHYQNTLLLSALIDLLLEKGYVQQEELLRKTQTLDEAALRFARSLSSARFE